MSQGQFKATVADEEEWLHEMTADELRAALHYEPRTGIFTRAAIPGHSAGIAGSMKSTNGYVNVTVGGRRYLAHRLAWLYVYGEWPTHHIDHINGDRTDNRIANLRDVSRAINQQNQRKAHSGKKSTGLMGAFHSRGKWIARIRINGKLRAIGTFDTDEEAHAAYLAAKRELHAGCTI